MLKKRRSLKGFIAIQLLKAGKSGSEVNIVFCSDDEVLEINKEHLRHDYFTDIITFDLSEKSSGFLVSDIYISVDRVRDNAQAIKGSLNDELHRVIFHGILHLIGYKDKTSKEAKK
ncbi:rRNA maturation RNase YbeY [Niabella ginsengisoli]|uniref:rRNA maturation RNase YbeY n=1 Tax=Niabella ginsengisoli TaxID=522298 RepID=A0ABS9SNJ0_9BACT|nr:rRNA maturation RNase YbeY [Niabella ginsengisoli]MCH5599940.1 rRNA maturation RNase YbeY [Niabella ginsengisoli]